MLNSSLVIDFAARRNPGQNRQIHIVAAFSNTTSRSISELHFQVAVERVSISPLTSALVVTTFSTHQLEFDHWIMVTDFGS